jgi:hypothetical protein
MAKPDPAGLKASLAHTTTGKPYLGDYKVVYRLLSHLGNAFLQGTHANAEDLASDVDQAARELAGVFLGKDADFSGPPWNSPGQIDLHVAKRCGIISVHPEERVAGGLVAMVGELLKLASDGRDDWMPAVDHIMTKYTRIFLGLPLGI